MKHILYTAFFTLLSFSCFSQGYSGLIGRWSFNGNANDVSGNGLNGIVRGATLTAGFSGAPNTAYLFNGTSDYITVPYNALMNAKIHSICVLVKPLGFNNGPCQGNYIVCRGWENNSDFYGLEFQDNSYDSDCSTYTPSQDVFSGSTGAAIVEDPGTSWYNPPPIVANTWYCVVLTYDGSIARVYVNGTLRTIHHETSTYVANTDTLDFGRSENNSPFEYFTHAAIDEIRIYNRVLSPTEVNMFCDSAEAIVTPETSTCDSVSLPDTVTGCTGTTVTLPATLYGTNTPYIHWSPATGLSDTTILSPSLTITTPGWYKVSVSSIIPGNLVVNGDFSAGNVGFSSSYPYVVSGPGALSPAGEYTITTDPSLNNPFGAASFGDHTTGTGNMLAVNGASTPTDVWCETFTVTPNTYYNFSAWFANWSSDTTANLPIIQYKINGVLTGPIFSFPHADGIWKQFSMPWYSGTSTSVSLCINDQQTSFTGNDFAIDDIVLNGSCVAIDSIYVGIKPNAAIQKNETVIACQSEGAVILKAPSSYAAFLWSTGSTASSITTVKSGDFWVEAFGGDCTSLIDTFRVSLNSSPIVSIGNDTTICKGASIKLISIEPAGALYKWSTGNTTNSILVSNPGVYTLNVTINGCSTTDSITVSQLRGPTAISLGADTTLCNGTEFSLHVNATNVDYKWSDGSKADTLQVTDGGEYWVTATNICGAVSDSINITFDLCDIWFPSAFTPNRDGKNDIARVVGSLSKYKDFTLAIYNRWGQRVFYTQDIYEGWDGKFNGVDQDLGVFVYYINYSLNGKKTMMKGDITLIR